MPASKTAPMVRREEGLKRLAPLLEELRALEELREKRPGSFSYRSRAFLHFHYRPDGSIVCDVRLSEAGFSRIDVSEELGRDELLREVKRCLDDQGRKEGEDR